MNRMMITSAVTMGQLQKKLDTIGHNMANLNTTGYKRREANFQDLLYQQFETQPKEEEEVGRRSPNGVRQGTGAKLAETRLRLEQGSIKETGRDLDIAIMDESQFFQVMIENENGNQETQFTRDGAFYLSEIDNELTLVTKNGNPVQGINGRITIPQDFQDIHIKETGEIDVTYNDGYTETIAELDLVEILRPDLLQSVGENRYRFPDVEELGVTQEVFRVLEPGEAKLKQRALEQSNVDLSKEMTDMMLTQRLYQFHAKSISIADQMAGLVGDLKS